MEYVTVSIFPGSGRNCVHKRLHIGIRKRNRRWHVVNFRSVAQRVAFARAQADVLVHEMDEPALRKISQKSFRIASTLGNRALPVRQ
jgi:hypothetical protein